ncbi:sperm acrosome membrane-associated protein 6 isoform X3 [Hyaena hyaena]|uniref:sperm acrosome membrane-associated protein 6 isoform X3 n=1 Tax=Hyaena hyaena TaxID=95912 RepID=UPI00192392AE|nr:sperm acrosome membrane-associated protein 6 isoform X3 [Hyaena hyaena]
MALLARDSAVPSALVALTVFRAPAWACLICFTSYKERTRICQIFVGTQGPQLEACQEAFSSAFADLADTEINYDERSHLRDAFTQMTHSLQEIAVAQGSFKVAFLEAAKKMQKVIMELKGAQACVPPCGFQDVARRFVCFGCYSKACNLPLDCPVQDLTVTRGQQAKFSCTVNFQLPKEEITYSWRSERRTSPTSETSRGPKDTWRGSGRCSPRTAGRSLARSCTTSAQWRGSTSFLTKVLRWKPRETELEPWRPSLSELLARPEALTPGNQFLLAALAAIASASATLLAWIFFRWYFRSN